MRAFAFIAVVVFCACPKRDAAPVEVAATPAALDAGARPIGELIDAWLAYHRDLARDADAGLDAVARARRERSVRSTAGVSESEIDTVETLIGAVVTQRTIAKLTGAEALKEFERATGTLKPEQRQKVEAAFGEVKSRAAQSATLEAERATFGDDAVNAVLAKEAEVTAMWEQLLEGRGERK